MHTSHRSQKSGSIGGDIGCGNGKYLGLRPDCMMIGCDRSTELVKIVKSRGFECFVSDGLDTGFKDECLDFTISIAVIHHFSSSERRREAIQELLRITRKGGSIIVFVWAMEQEKRSKRRFETQDEMVSWTTTKNTIGPDGEKHSEQVTLHRYYHLFWKGELEQLCTGLDCIVKQSGYDRDNHYVILERI